MKYNDFKVKAITLKEANLILELLNFYKIEIVYIGLNDSYNEAKMAITGFNYTKYAVIKENEASLWIETRYYEPKNRATRYICWLDGEKRPVIKGLHAFNKLQQYCFKAKHVKHYKNPEIDRLYDHDTGKYVFSAGPIIGFNPQYEGQELHDVWEYDIHSAYSSVMLHRIPDINHPKFNCLLKKNQVGFFLDEKCTMVKTEGCWAQVVFDLIELSPKQKEYIRKLYQRKEYAIDDDEKAECKLMLNASIGYYQRFNPFVRAYIVHECNRCIKAIIDDETVLWNTDAIFSLKRRPELELGNEIGQFKETHIDRFAYKGNNYQINYEKPKYRGKPNSWFMDGWDILKDPLPERCNKFKLDLDKLKITKNEEYYEKIDKSAKSKE